MLNKLVSFVLPFQKQATCKYFTISPCASIPPCSPIKLHKFFGFYVICHTGLALNSLISKPFVKTKAIMAHPWPVLDKRKAEVENSTDIAKRPRIKRKMHAILLAYCGQGYLGLQR